MQTVAIASQKGGTGKTTITVHLAVAAVRSGLSTAILDVDPQHSADVWFKARDAAGLVDRTLGPIVAAIDPGQVAEWLATTANLGVDLALIDTAPRYDAQAAAIARLADFLLMPVRPGLFDLAAARGTAAIAKAARKPGAFVLSACPLRAPEIAQARIAIAELGFPLAPVEITERRPYARAVIAGQAVDEFDPDGKAAGEINTLWKWLRKEIRNNGTR